MEHSNITSVNWQPPVSKHDAKAALKEGFAKFFQQTEVKKSIDDEHTTGTPERATLAMFELFAGCWEDPNDILTASFSSRKCDEMVYVNDLPFVSMCAHHVLPCLGKAYFAYIPDKSIVGISKIPRLIRSLAKRPQVQEYLTQDIVDTFNDIVKPKGCGVVVESWHLCMLIRGVEATPAYFKTQALRGVFKDGSTKEEFLNGVKQVSRQIWP